MRTREQSIRRIERAMDRAVKALHDVEQIAGHHGGFAVIREWLNHPVRGGQWAFRRPKR